MSIAILKHKRSAVIAAGFAISLAGSTQASVISSSPIFPPIPLSFSSLTGAGCFDTAGVCVTPGIFTLTSAVPTFNMAGQEIDADATYTGSLTTLPPGSAPLGSFTLTGTVDFDLLGRTSSTETGSWTTELTGMSLSGPLLGGTLTATLELEPVGRDHGQLRLTHQVPADVRQFVITSFFDIFCRLVVRQTGAAAAEQGCRPDRGHRQVPESSTWAMLIIGFAGLSSAAYRRRAAATA